VVAQSCQDDAHVPEGAGLSERVVRPPVQRQRLPVALDRGPVVLEQFLDDAVRGVGLGRGGCLVSATGAGCCGAERGGAVSFNGIPPRN